MNEEIKKFIDNKIKGLSNATVVKLIEVGYFETDLIDEIITEFDIDDLTSEEKEIMLDYINNTL